MVVLSVQALGAHSARDRGALGAVPERTGHLPQHHPARVPGHGGGLLRVGQGVGDRGAGGRALGAARAAHVQPRHGQLRGGARALHPARRPHRGQPVQALSERCPARPTRRPRPRGRTARRILWSHLQALAACRLVVRVLRLMNYALLCSV